MAKLAARKKRGRPVRQDDHVGPTPETLAKLRQDPLLALFERYDGGTGSEEGALERAADEIRAVYLAVCGMLMAGIGGGHRYGQGPGVRREIPPFLAWAHGRTYLPWANSLKRTTLEAVIDLVVEPHGGPSGSRAGSRGGAGRLRPTHAPARRLRGRKVVRGSGEQR